MGEERVRARGTVTFEQAAWEWLRYVELDRKRRPCTVRDYRNLLRRDLLPEFGEERIGEIDDDRIERYRTRLVAEGRLADRTINKQLVVLHGIFKRAMKVHKLARNPAATVDRQPDRGSGDFSVLSAAEVEAVARAAPSVIDAAVFRTAAFTGLRLGELLALRWQDVDFGRRLVRVRRSYVLGHYGAPKSGKVRSVPMIDQVLSALDRLSRRERFVAPGDLVFCGPLGQPIDGSGLRRRFYGSLERAGLPRIRFHDLRHTFGTLAVQVFPLSDVKAYMGHADISTTMIYVHHVPRHDAADKLSAAIRAETEPVLAGSAALG